MAKNASAGGPPAGGRLTPDDIVNYPLKQAVRGYSVAQVDRLLDRVADEFERIGAEWRDLRARLARCEEQLAATSETEGTLKRTLVTAQRAAEQSLEEAKARAAEMLDEARSEAAGVVEQARLAAESLRVEAVQAARAEEAEVRRRRQELEAQVESLRVFEREYRTRLREHLDQHVRALDELEAGPGATPEAAPAPAGTPPGPQEVSQPTPPAQPDRATGGAGDDETRRPW